MGVDLYAGPLQRYYTRRWETPAQVHARENGLSYKIIHAGGIDPLSLSEADAAQRVRTFQQALQPKLELDLEIWREAQDVPYRTVQLTHQGLSALVLWAAYQHRPDLERPRKLPEDVWAIEAVEEAHDRGYYLGPMAVVEAHMIVPGVAPRVTAETDPIGRQHIIVTTGALDEAIRALAPSLAVAEDSIDRVLKKMPSLSGEVMVRRKAWERHRPEWYSVAEPRPDDEVEAFARYGLACFISMRDFSREHGVPILRDE